MLLPFIEDARLGYDAPLPQPFVDHIRRLCVGGLVVLHLPVQARSMRGLSHLAPLIALGKCIVGPFLSSEVDAATLFLDAGAPCAYFDVDISGREGIVAVADALSSLPPNRLGISVRMSEPQTGALDGSSSASLEHCLAMIASLREMVGTVLVSMPVLPTSKDLCDRMRVAAGVPRAQLIVVAPGAAADGTVHAPAASSPEEIGRLHRSELHVSCPSFIDHGIDSVSVRGDGAVNGAGSAVAPPDASSTNGGISSGGGAHAVDIGRCIAACTRTDRTDGLIATIVNDEHGKSLGLVYSSKESILEAIRCGRGVYYSRSRGGLWRKGDTSGAWQELLGIQLDCDSDALLFTVRQMGSPPAFCHLNSRTCWGEDSGLSALERTLYARKADAPEGSYTKRLFNDPELLRNKLLEEAQELAEATDRDHVTAEAADLIYFTLVSCARAGVKIADIEAHLDKRALKVRRRPGDAKASRIAAANAHFKAVQESAEAKQAAVAAETGAPTTAGH